MIKTEYLIFLAAILPFLPALWGEFVFDDWEAVVNNPIVNGKAEISQVLWRDFWGRDLSSPHSHKSYRPLTTLLFRLQWALFRGIPQYFHAVGLLLHLLVSYLLFKTLKQVEEKLNIKKGVADVAAVAFALHPVHIEAIANITCQCELLSALFLLAGLKFYLFFCQNLTRSKLFLLFSLAICSVLAKEQGISLLPICCVLGFLLKRNHVHLRLLAGLSLFLAGIRLKIGGGAPKFTANDNPAAFVESPILRWFSIAWQWFLHLKLLLAPFQFCFDYSMGCIPPIIGYSDPRIVLILFGALLLVSVVIKFYKNLEKDHQKLLIFGCLFGGIAFFPASNILLTIGFPLAERVLYLPSVGFCLIFGIFWRKLEKIHGKMDSHALVLIFLAGVICFERSREWTTELNLYSSGLKVCPGNAKIHYNLGKILSDRGNLVEAEREYKEAVRLYPSYEQALNNLGNLLEKQGRFNESEEFLMAAVATRPHFATAWMNLGIVMMNSGKYNASISAYQESLKLRPNSADCHFNLGNLYQKMGELELAAIAWKASTGIQPSHCPSWTNLLVVLDELGRCSAVLTLETEIMRSCPTTPAIRSQLGVCHSHTGNFVPAEEHFLAAMALAPFNTFYRSNYDVLQGLKHKDRGKV